MLARDDWRIDPALICPQCLEESWTGDSCRICDFDNDYLQNSDKLRPGVILNGRYFVGLVLGHEGGFGVTYKGRDLVGGGKVAIKEYFPSQLAGRARKSLAVQALSPKHQDYYSKGLKQFRTEAELLQTFHHPSIVTVTEFFEANATAYFIMPFVEGKTLAELVEAKGGRIDFKLASRLMTPVLDALRYTHHHNLIHRDVSPENIYINRMGHVTLLDFGAARSPIPGMGRTRIIKAGFTAEEVTTGIAQGPPTDVYGAAATLYYICVGELVTSPNERRANIALIPPSQRKVQISRAAESALLRALSLRPEDRFQSIADFQKALSVTDYTSLFTKSTAQLFQIAAADTQINPRPIRRKDSNPFKILLYIFLGVFILSVIVSIAVVMAQY